MYMHYTRMMPWGVLDNDRLGLLEDRISSLENRLLMVARGSEQEARVALFEHHTSQMQGYKLYLLTIAVGSLGLVQVYGLLENWAKTSVLSGQAIWLMPFLWPRLDHAKS